MKSTRSVAIPSFRSSNFNYIRRELVSQNMLIDWQGSDGRKMRVFKTIARAERIDYVSIVEKEAFQFD